MLHIKNEIRRAHVEPVKAVLAVTGMRARYSSREVFLAMIERGNRSKRKPSDRRM